MKHWVPDEMRDGMRLIAELIGPRWIERKLLQEEKARLEIQRKIEDRKNAYLFRKNPHPLISWWILTRTWLDSDTTDDIPAPESAFRVAVLAAALASARSARGFERIVSRLKREAEFYSAAFEAVVAASYIDRHYQVEFVAENSQSKSPDLKVTQPSGFVFWVECKCRDEVIERDKAIRWFWKELQAALMRRLGPSKVNVMVAIKCVGEPMRDDLEPLQDFILQRLQADPPLNMFREPTKISPVTEPFGKYQVAAQIIAPPDEECEVQEFGVSSSEEFDYSTTGAECTPLGAGRMRIKNPFHYAFKTECPSDGVPGVLNAFKSAVDQLPSSGPGVVWLKIADGAWGKDFDGFMSRVGVALRKELSGEHNRRVNAAIVHARGLEMEPLDGGPQVYRSAQLVVEHVNPRALVPQAS